MKFAFWVSGILSVSVLCSFAFASPLAVDLVNPFIGTAIHNDPNLLGGGLGGNTLPGAAYPFGMLLWSPDTKLVDSAVYEYRQNQITGFSLTHLSGPGCAAAAQFPILPVTVPGVKAVGYSHQEESATPGFYAVTLDNGVRVQLSVTARSAIGRFQFPSGKNGHLILDASSTPIPNRTLRAELKAVSQYEIRGWSEGGFFCGAKNATIVHFILRSETPFQFTDFGGGKIQLSYPPGQTATVKMALSYVSAAGAGRNLDLENPAFDFNAVKNSARDEWQRQLSKIEIVSPDLHRQQIFYTALYHSLLHPNIFSDQPLEGSKDGQYIGFDGQIHLARGYTHYANFSGWDTYRSQAQLLAWLYPKEASDMMKSYTADADQCGAFPKWAEFNFETNIMNGDPAAGIVAGSYAFGARDFPVERALQHLINTGTVPGTRCQHAVERPGLSEYLALGYIPDMTPGVWGPVATSLEYNVADYAVAQFAKALGDETTASAFLKRSKNWQLNFDKNIGLPRRRLADGSWYGAGNNSNDPMSIDGFVEGNAYQYLWFVPHDARGLINWLGGDQVAIQRLNDHFAQTNAGPRSKYFYVGNEPSFHTPWLYNWTVQPSRTQAQVRALLDGSFTTEVDGLPGNDDLGAMSSWYVFSALGLFPAVPGEAKLSLGSPLFEKAVVHLQSGKDLVINAPGAPLRYIQSAEGLSRPWLPESMIFGGGVLNLKLGNSPNDGIWAKP